MANTKSAKKDILKSEENHARNKSVKSGVRSSIVKAEKAIAAGNLDEAKKTTGTAVSTLDKAAEKGIIHANNAARRKSRLMAKLNQAVPAKAPEKAA